MIPAEQPPPAPPIESPEATASPQFPQYEIPGFEKLPKATQRLYLKIPPSLLDAARPRIELEIATVEAGNAEVAVSEREDAEAGRIESAAAPRRDQADAAIATFHRAERGDPDARKELTDAKRELLGEEATDEEVLQTVLEDQSGNLFADDVVLEVMLSDEETEAYQRVLDLFQEFHGERGSVDSVIKPKQQIDLFCELTKGIGSLTERMFFARKALAVLTDGGKRSLFSGFQALGILDGGKVVEGGVRELRRLAAGKRENGKGVIGRPSNP